MLEVLTNFLSRFRSAPKEPEKPRRTLYVSRVPTGDERSVVFFAYDPLSKKGGQVEKNVIGLVGVLESQGYNLMEAPAMVNVGYEEAPPEVIKGFGKMLGASVKGLMVLNRGDYGKLSLALADRAEHLRETRQREAKKAGEGDGAAALRKGVQEVESEMDKRKGKK